MPILSPSNIKINNEDDPINLYIDFLIYGFDIRSKYMDKHILK